jgi:hypothetical protein
VATGPGAGLVREAIPSDYVRIITVDQATLWVTGNRNAIRSGTNLPERASGG